MSLPLAIAALSAAGVARQLTMRKTRTLGDLKDRFGTKAHGQLGAVEARPAISGPCTAYAGGAVGVVMGVSLSDCTWDQAVAASYAQCAQYPSGIVEACTGATALAEVGKDLVDTVKSWF